MSEQLQAATVDHMSDDEIRTLISNIDYDRDCVLDTKGLSFAAVSVFRLTEDTVTKPVDPFEPYMMRWVAERTSVRLPRVRRCVQIKRQLWMLIEYVAGEDLVYIWPHLSIWRKIMTAWTIRGYIHQLRAMDTPYPSVPGPFDETGTPLQCSGLCFGEHPAGPFGSYQELYKFYRGRLLVTLDWKETRGLLKKAGRAAVLRDPKLNFDASQPLVFTHNDISMWNVRIRQDGTVWLLDWGAAGLFPRWFEYANMMGYERNVETSRSWTWMIPFMAGFYSRSYHFIKNIRVGLMYYHWDPSDESS